MDSERKTDLDTYKQVFMLFTVIPKPPLMRPKGIVVIEELYMRNSDIFCSTLLVCFL